MDAGTAKFDRKSYNVDTIWEDDGNKASGVTIAVHDSERGNLMLHGVMMDYLLVCKV